MRKSVLLLAAAVMALDAGRARSSFATSIRATSPKRSASMPVGRRNSAAPRQGRAPPMSQSVGRRVGAHSGLANPGQALHFTTLNSAVENAFSVPGGYVYVDAPADDLMDDESELAFALGHEVGHVAANHAHIREQYAQRSSYGVLGAILGAIFGETFSAS